MEDEEAEERMKQRTNLRREEADEANMTSGAGQAVHPGIPKKIPEGKI